MWAAWLAHRRAVQPVTDLKVVSLRDGPLLNDIPGMLRRTADRIESGDVAEADVALLIIPQPGDWPRVFGFGDTTGSNDPIVILELAKAWFVNNMVKRG